ncbi:MAG: tRNA 5-methoxyuridine(34)/uridine 5-oxyacetic acid(34) synthase CmoB [Opitutales bacterium]
MLFLESLWPRLAESADTGRWPERLAPLAVAALEPERNGHWPRWQPALDSLPRVSPSQVNLDHPVVTIGIEDDLSAEAAAALPAHLDALHPWRKGPWKFFGQAIDTEWRSDWKWERLERGLLDVGLKEAVRGWRVLDIGAGNGYYGWRWRGLGADLVLGLDPFLAYAVQFAAAKRYLVDEPVFHLPLGIEALDGLDAAFDCVCSLGVIYHRRDPVEHLRRLQSLCQPGGLGIVESITIPGAAGEWLEPQGRYARMRNVHWLPTPGTLVATMRAAGWRDVQEIDTSRTTTDEQRSTPWMRFESLAQCLDPKAADKTVEGHPSPWRSLVFGRA